MGDGFNHLLLTKFNILTSPKYGPPERRLNDEWLQRRLAEFETFSLPSVRGQTEKNFRWLIFCDALSPEWFRARMQSYSDVLEPVWIEQMTNATMGNVLRLQGYLDDRPLITTRLDNDDALSVDFIETIHGEYIDEDRVYINFPWGLRACDGALFTGYWKSNPFMTYIEQPHADEEFRGIYFLQHQTVKATERIRDVNRAPSWLRSMHSANTVQTQVGLPRIRNRSARFNIEWDKLPPAPNLVRKTMISVGGYKARVARSSKFRSLYKSVTGREPTTSGW